MSTTPKGRRFPGLALAAYALALCAASASCVRQLPYSLTPNAPPARVRFVPPEGSEAPVTVSVTPPGMGPFECQAPCSMLLPAGTYGASVATRGRVGSIAAVVPSGDSLANVQFQRSGVAVGGRVLGATGGVFASVAASILPFNAFAVVIALSSIALVLLIPGVIMMAAAGSDGLAFTNAPSDTFTTFRGIDDRRRMFTRVEADLAPALPVARWAF